MYNFRLTDAAETHRKHQFLRQAGYGKFDTFHRADLRISDIGNLLGSDWTEAARELGVDEADADIIRAEYPDNQGKNHSYQWLNIFLKITLVLNLFVCSCSSQASKQW